MVVLYWVLPTAIEILSRYAFAIPVYTKDISNMTKSGNPSIEAVQGQIRRLSKAGSVRRWQGILQRWSKDAAGETQC